MNLHNNDINQHLLEVLQRGEFYRMYQKMAAKVGGGTPNPHN